MRTSRFKSGFTLIELIVVVVILSIISIYSALHFSEKKDFSIYAIQERVIAVVRQIQINRMQSNFPTGYDDDNFILNVSQQCLGSVEACSLAEQEQEARSDLVKDSSVTFEFDNGLTERISFDLLGNPEVDIKSDISILIRDVNSQGTCRVKINNQGYIYKGECL